MKIRRGRRSWFSRVIERQHAVQASEQPLERSGAGHEEKVTQAESRQLDILMEEWRARTEAIRHRQDLEQKNTNVAIVLVASVASYLLVYVSQNSVSELFEREVALMIPVVSIIVSSFQLRQLDHEVNIADYGAYVRHVVGPSLAVLAERDVVRYEVYIDHVRRRRTRGLLGVLMFGNETFQLLFLSVATAILSVMTVLAWGETAGGAAHSWLIGGAIASLALTLVCAWQTVAMLWHYQSVNRTADAWAKGTHGETEPANQHFCAEMGPTPDRADEPSERGRRH